MRTKLIPIHDMAMAQINSALPREQELLEAMQVQGGSFDQAIAKAWVIADSTNKAILRENFNHRLADFRCYLKEV